MKKILLSFFLLTSLNFYSQIADIAHCAGDTTFNLTYQYSLLIGNLNPAETTVSYHLTLADASNGVNAISNPTNFIVPQNQGNVLASQTIHARINHLGDITTNYFNLIVNPYLMALGNIKPIDCYSDGNIMLDVFGGQAPFICIINGYHNFSNFVHLDNNHSILPIPNLVAGIYNIQIIDAIGCYTFSSWTIEPSSIIRLDTPTVTLTNVKCKGNNDGAITINATGGKLPYSYSIDDGATYVPNNTFTNLVAGKYFTYVKDANGCTDLRTYNITEPTSLQVAGAVTKPIDCISNATVTLTAIGGTSPYTYSIDGFTFVQSNVFDNLTAGNYTAFVKDTNGCMSQNPIVISPLAPLNATIVKTDVRCNGNNDGSITINATGGRSPYVYSLDNGLTYVSSNAFTNLSSRTYNIVVKDSNNCTSSVIATITKPVLLSMTAAITKPIDCISNANLTLMATGGIAPYTYSKDGIQYTQNNIFDNLAAGIYTTSVKDSNGCINSSNSITVIPLRPLSISTSVINVNCKGNSDGSITINATGGQAPYVYSLDNGVNYVSSNVFINLVPGTYKIAVKDSNYCISSVTTTIVEPDLLSMVAAITKPIDCISNATVTLTATGGTAPYTYSIDGFTFGQSNVFNNLAAGTYTTFVKDANGCINQNFIVISPLTPLNTTIIKTDVRCKGNNDASITINAMGGQTPYVYSHDNGVTYVSSNVFTNLVSGTYNIVVKDSNNCTSSMIATIGEPDLLSMTAAITKPIDCVSNATMKLAATGGTTPYTYSKDGITFVQSNVFDNLAAGIYTASVKDANGCINQNSIVISPLTPLNAAIVKTDVRCNGNNDGSITINATGGRSPFVYSLDNGVNYVSDNVFTNLVPGTYNIVVKDSNNCTSSVIATITKPALLSMTAAITKPIDCVSNAAATLTTTGGTAPYTYSKDGFTFVQSNVFDNLAAGSYNIFVKDANGCISQNSIVISPLTLLNTTITKTDLHCNGNNDGTITVITTGGQAPYSYSLDGGTYGTSNTFYKLYAGIHNILTKDLNGCISLITSTISEPALLSATVSVENQNITVKAKGGTGAYRYSIHPGSQTTFPINNTFINLYPSIYTITIQDENSCYFTVTAIVNPPAPLINGSNIISINFTEGQTLADLVVPGQNIKWYSAPNTTTSKSKKTAETPLPLSTVLVNNTTYYASQTINGIESKERLAVTVKSSALGTNDLAFKNFSYYPNPVKNVLTLSNTSVIDEAILISIKGETLLAKKINSPLSVIDLSNLSTGIYFLKIKSEGAEKTVKLIKE